MKKNILLTTLASIAMSQNLQAMVVHEWGTFTSLQGSNGKDQIGIYHDDEELPDFVHGLGEVLFPPVAQPPAPIPAPTPAPPSQAGCHFKALDCDILLSNRITQRMETPVIYFYSDEPRTERVRIEVDFPLGVISETFPAPVVSVPKAGATVLTNGFARFDVDVLPQNTNVTIPFVQAGNIYGHARNVNSNYLRAGHEHEKFIFYRGVGKFEGSLQVTYPKNQTQDLTIMNINPIGDQPIQQMLLIHTNADGSVAHQELLGHDSQGFRSGDRITISNDKLSAFISGTHYGQPLKVQRALAHSLVRSGLRYDEAQAMVDTWGHGYFQTPGIRILYILAPETVERILPMKVTPAPEELLRVMVGRLEFFAPGEEATIVRQVLMQDESFNISSLGRFAEAKLRAALEYHKSSPHKPPTVQLFESLIEKARLQ